MNKYIVLVMKWLNNPQKVTEEDIEKYYKELNLYKSSECTMDFYGGNNKTVFYYWTELCMMYCSLYMEKDLEFALEAYFKRTGEDREDYEKVVFMEDHGLGEEDMKGGNLSDVS